LSIDTAVLLRGPTIKVLKALGERWSSLAKYHGLASIVPIPGSHTRRSLVTCVVVVLDEIMKRVVVSVSVAMSRCGKISKQVRSISMERRR